MVVLHHPAVVCNSTVSAGFKVLQRVEPIALGPPVFLCAFQSPLPTPWLLIPFPLLAVDLFLVLGVVPFSLLDNQEGVFCRHSTSIPHPTVLVQDLCKSTP